jgi:hypothetical protein
MGVSIIECSQPKGIKPKMRGHKLRSGVYWQGAFKQNGIKHKGHETRATCKENYPTSTVIGHFILCF